MEQDVIGTAPFKASHSVLFTGHVMAASKKGKLLLSL